MKKILRIVLVLVIGFLIYASTRPDTFHVERTGVINAPAETVYGHIVNFHDWQAWSPWEKLDPNMKKTFGALGFVYVFLLGNRLAGPICGAAAVMLLFVHGPLLFSHGLRTNNMEAALFLSYCAGFYHYVGWARSNSRVEGRQHAIAAGLAFAGVSAAEDKIDGCSFHGKALKGKVQIVSSGADFKVQAVTSFPDLKVQFVESFPDDCGEWQVVESFPDFTIQYVTSFPDFTIQMVTSFPGEP